MLTLSILSFVALGAVSACTGSAATLSLRPDFQVTTSAGPASVSVRDAPPDMTLAEFDQSVKSGMEAAIGTKLEASPLVGPFPQRRIVWHVNSMPESNSSRLVVNVFNESAPLTDEQQVVDNADPPDILAGTVSSMTRRLLAKIDRHDQAARG